MTITKQQMFDEVAAALLKQNKKCRAVNSSGGFSCVYEDLHTKMRCAVGHMLPDEAIATIHRWKENESSLGKMLAIFGAKEHEQITFIRENMMFVRCMQDIHDNTMPDEWARDLIIVAKRYNLHYDVVTNFTKENA